METCNVRSKSPCFPPFFITAQQDAVLVSHMNQMNSLAFRDLSTRQVYRGSFQLRLKIQSVFHSREMLNAASLVLIVELKIHHLSSPINKTNAAIVWSEGEGK